MFPPCWLARELRVATSCDELRVSSCELARSARRSQLARSLPIPDDGGVRLPTIHPSASCVHCNKVRWEETESIFWFVHRSDRNDNECWCGKGIICNRELCIELPTANREMSVWLQLLHRDRPDSSVRSQYHNGINHVNVWWRIWFCTDLDEATDSTFFLCAYYDNIWRIVHTGLVTNLIGYKRHHWKYRERDASMHNRKRTRSITMKWNPAGHISVSIISNNPGQTFCRIWNHAHFFPSSYIH